MDTEEDNCPICLDLLTEDVYELNCKHSFHKNCIQRWLLTSTMCPLCRTHVDPDPRYVNDHILSEARRLHIDTVRKFLTSVSKGMERYFPSDLQGYSQNVTDFLDSDWGNSLLEQAAADSTGSLETEKIYHNVMSGVEEYFDLQ